MRNLDGNSDMLDPVLCLGPFGVVPAAHIAHQISGDAANPGEGLRGQMIGQVHILPIHMDVQRLHISVGILLCSALLVGLYFLRTDLTTCDLYLHKKVSFPSLSCPREGTRDTISCGLLLNGNSISCTSRKSVLPLQQLKKIRRERMEHDDAGGACQKSYF